MRKFLNKLTCIALSLTFLMGCMATPAFAYSREDSEETMVPSIFETEEEPATVVEQDAGPLTPEGNLAVVDDYQTTFSDGTAQQFITLVSKSGAYFYLIIDRAADGDQTAHFLNMVDEADLLALMDEKDIPEPEPEPAPAPEPESMPEPEPEAEDGAGKFVLVLLVLAGIAGGGAYPTPITGRMRRKSFCRRKNRRTNLTRMLSAGRIRIAMGTRRSKTE